MFYLKELLLIIRDHKALALTNLMFLALFTGILQFKGNVRGFFSMDSKTSTSPYFNALVGGTTGADYIARKMKNLPGVANVEVKKSDKLQAEVSGFLKELGGAEVGQTYNAFKVVLDRGIRPESRKLIKEYFSRLAGKNDVTFSQIKTPKPARFKNSPWYAFFAKWSDVYLATLAAFGWVFTLWLIGQPMKAQSFVIERFQRKDKTALKMFAWLWALPLVGFIVSALAFDLRVSLVDFAPGLALLALGSLFFLGREKSPRRFI